MKRNGYGILCFVVMIFGIQQNTVLKDLQQLSGTWKMQTAKLAMYESWKIIDHNEMHCKSYLLRASDTTILEEVKLMQNTEGVFYIPIVKDRNQRKPVSFKLVSSVDKQFVFENPTHDYPQRIIYHLVTGDSVHAWIEGRNKGRQARSDYYFKRVSCKPVLSGKSEQIMPIRIH